MNTYVTQAELNQLRDKFLLFGGQAEVAIAQATQALVHRDSGLARLVIDEDDEIDNIESEIDQMCVDLLRFRNSSDDDLRFIVSIVRATPMVERIADHAVNIARHTLKLNNEPQLKPYIDLPRMANIVHHMLIDALDAMAEHDAKRARAIILSDKEVDQLYRRIFDELLMFMSTDGSCVVRAAELLFVIKHLERIADYVTNICEQVVYMVEGSNIKHCGNLRLTGDESENSGLNLAW